MINDLTLWTFLSLAVAEDVWHMKISNRMILCGLFWGFAIRLMRDGPVGIPLYVLNVLLPVVLLILLFQLHVLGAGDIKLFSVTGSFLTTEQLVRVIAFSFLIAAVVGAGMVIQKRCREKKAQYMYTKMHFSIPILLAVVLTSGGV